MVSPSPDLQRKMNNTENIINAGKSHLVDRLQSKYPRDYLELHVHSNLMTKKPWMRQNTYNKNLNLNSSNLKKLFAEGDKILIIAVEFNDRLHTISITDIYNRFFGTIGKTLRNYYIENSYGIYVPDGIIIGWYMMPQTYAYYRDDPNTVGCDYGMSDGYPHNVQRLFEDALSTINNDPNVTSTTLNALDIDGDGRLERVFIVHAGGEAAFGSDCNELWAAEWTIKPKTIKGKTFSTFATSAEYLNVFNDIQRSGIDCHEFGHELGLPDLYDYSNNTNGVGVWSLMGSGSWGDTAMTPVHLDAWSKNQLGWSTIVTNPTGQITINYIERQIIKYITPDIKEFFLIENRQKSGFDLYLPGSGLLIWHVNDNKDQYTDINCHTVTLLQADGLKDLENKINSGDPYDPYPSLGNNRSFTISTNPSPLLCNNSKQSIFITNISDSKDIMTMDVTLSCSNIMCDFSIVN